MKRHLIFLGTYLIVQPSFILGMAGLIGKQLGHESLGFLNLPAVIEYQNNQVEITKANKRKPDSLTVKTDNAHLNDLENYLMVLEDEPNLMKGASSTTQLGQKMKYLSKTILFTG